MVLYLDQLLIDLIFVQSLSPIEVSLDELSLLGICDAFLLFLFYLSD